MSEAQPVRAEKIRCDACPVLCFIAEGRNGACSRYANDNGELIRLDPLTVVENGAPVVAFLGGTNADTSQDDDTDDGAMRVADWDGDLIQGYRPFVTAVGAGTTYPDYKPAPFIVSQQVDDVDMVTVVTEGIFSYCGAKVKIDTDRHIGEEAATVRVNGEAIGHVMTGEYGSKMLSLGGVEHLTGGSKKEGRVACDALLRLCNREAVEMSVDEGAVMIIQAGQAPIIDGVPEKLMRVGCGSAAIGMFAKQWMPLVDEVVVVDDHITGVLSEHEAGRGLDMRPSGIKVAGRKSTAGRYFQVAEPGTGWGGTNVTDPLSILKAADPKTAWPGARLLMISTTGEQWAYFELDDDLVPQKAEISPELEATAQRLAENCEPSLCSVLFMGGAGGSLRAGVTENPVRLTRSVRSALTYVSCGGAEAYVWPGGGITIMADVMDMPSNAFGYVPTPALVAPIEFTLRREDYEALGGHMEYIRPVEDVLGPDVRAVVAPIGQTDPNDRGNYRWAKNHKGVQ